jgi:hypothetical protein
MKRFLLVFAGFLLCALPAAADAPGGTIAIFADPLGENCYPEYIAPGLFQIYVVHINHGGVVGSAYKVVADEDFDGVYLGEHPIDPSDVVVGYAFAGISMGYGACLPPPISLVAMSFYMPGSPKKCCYFSVVEHPYEGLAAVNCSFVKVPAEGGTSYVNPDGTCQCNIPGVTTPVQPSTWGLVKSLYASD